MKNLLLTLLCILGHLAIAQVPTITSFTPTSGTVGTTVTINGSNFSNSTFNNIVKFGATAATVTAASPSQLTVTVPIGATFAPITVLNTSTNLLAYSISPFTPTFAPTKGSIAATDFDPKVDFNTGNNMRAIALGDLDGDGKADMVVANYSSATVSVFRNTGSSGTVSYAPKVDFAVNSSNNVAIAIGDLDGDGKGDLAVVSESGSQFSVLRNISNPGVVNFDFYQNVSSSNNLSSIIIVDLDGDGKADVAASRNQGGGGRFTVVRNLSSPGSLSFSASQNFGTGGGFESQSIAAADLDGDGKQEIVTANFGANNVSVFSNASSSGSIFFSAPFDFTTGSGPYSVAVGDLDGDGKADLAVANSLSNTVSVLRNTGVPSISFATKVDFTTGTAPRSVAIGDLDGDGKPDLAIANNSGSSTSILRNTGSIGTVSFVPKVDLTTFNNPESVAIGDLDGDGKSDLAVATFASTISVIRNNPDVSVVTISSISPESGPVGTSVTINGSNFNTTPANNVVFFGATAATVNAATANQLTVTVPTGATYAPITVINTSIGLLAYSMRPFTPTFLPTKGRIAAADFDPKVDFFSGSIPSSVAIGDFDGDGKADLAVANQGEGIVSVFRNTGSSGTVNYAAKLDFATGTNPNSVAIGDLDGDGKLDFAVTSSIGVSTFRNTGSPGTVSFASRVDFFTGLNPQSVAISDLDGDSKADLAVTNYGNNTVSILRNTSSVGIISYALKVDFSTGTNPYFVGIGDLDGDEKPDLAVANYNENSVSILRNTSSVGIVSFATKVDYTANSLPQSIAIGDLDGDSKADLAVVSSGVFGLSIFRNTGSIGTISYAPKVDFATPVSFSYSVSMGDLDGDSKADLALSANSIVYVFRNTGSSGVVNFAPEVSLAAGTSASSVAIGDLDGDGKSDIAVTNSINVSVIRNNPLTPPTITTFPDLSLTLYDTPFTLTAPTSDSPGTFSYASSNLAVATVSGNTVTIIATGVTIITATQAQSGTFEGGSITATLTVTAVETVTIYGERTLFKQTYPNKSGALGLKKGLNRNGKEEVAKH